MAIETILWGDDEKPFLNMIVPALTEFFGNYQVDTAETPEKLIEMASAKKHDVIVTDLNYSKAPTSKDGFDVIAAVKDRAKYVILCSANLDFEKIEKAKQLGAYDIFKKPLDLPTLETYFKNLE